MTRPTPGVPVTVLAANIESRLRSPMLRRLIRKHKPDVVIVEQAYRARRFLSSISNYQSLQWQDKPGGEWSGIAVLVRHDVEVKSVKPLVMRLSWTGPKAHKRHEPRVYPALVLNKQGAIWRVIGIHLPTHNQPAAQNESLRAVRDYFIEHDNSPIIAAGDWNMTEDELREAIRIRGTEALSDGTKVDHALVANGEHHRAEKLRWPRYAHGWAKYSTTIR